MLQLLAQFLILSTTGRRIESYSTRQNQGTEDGTGEGEGCQDWKGEGKTRKIGIGRTWTKVFKQ